LTHLPSAYTPGKYSDLHPQLQNSISKAIYQTSGHHIALITS